MLRGDAGDPVDFRLQQAHTALKRVLDDPVNVLNCNQQFLVKFMATKTKTKKEAITYVVRQVDFELRADMASDGDCDHLAHSLLLSSMAYLQLDPGDFS